MRRRARVDDNQKEIVKALRSVGATVMHLHGVHGGAPDILCGYKGVNYCLELKDGEKPPSKRKLTSDQEIWHTFWAGQAAVVKNEQEALEAIGAL